MKCTPLQVSLCVSLLVHGAILGTVCVARFTGASTGGAPVVEMEPEPLVFSVEPEPAASPVLTPSAVVEKKAETSIHLVALSVVAPVLDAKVPSLASMNVLTDWETDLAVADELQHAVAANQGDRRLPKSSAPASVNPVEAVCSPEYLYNPKPVYAEAARRRREEGLVLLALTVTREGEPANVRITRGSGHALLDDAALKAVWQWRFTPASVKHMAVSSSIVVPVRFKLSD
jgi:TonB family protein